jgi:hypothetical protein
VWSVSTDGNVASLLGSIIGECDFCQYQSVFDSWFNYLSKQDCEWVKHAAAGLHPPASDPMPTPVEACPAPTSISYTASHIASVKGFMPGKLGFFSATRACACDSPCPHLWAWVFMGMGMALRA